MRFIKSHIIMILGVITLLAVSCYETYWLYGLYKTNKESVIQVIRTSIARAELEEYSGKLLKKRNQIDSVMIVQKDSDVSAKLISMSLDSLKGKPTHVSVYKLNDPHLDSFFSKTAYPNIEKVEAHFDGLMKDANINIEHGLRFVSNVNGTDTLSTSAVNCNHADYNTAISIDSSIYDGRYTFTSASLSLYILETMLGTLVVSAGILLIIVIAFLLMNRAMNKQRKLEEMKSDFTRNMTHELKTPIAIAYAASDTLLDCGLGNNPTKREEYLTIIKEQLGKLEGMVEMILSTTMEKRDNLRLECSNVLLKPMLEEATSRIRLKADKACEVSLFVKPENLSAFVDEKLMSSVFLTILDNAVKYSGEKVKIVVEAYRTGNRTIVSIADNGIGMTSQDMRHVFDKFFRVSSGDRHDAKGYGIGLFFAKGIIEKHGGNISVKSVPGEGSTFIMEL